MKPILPGLRRVETDAEIFAHRYVIAITVTLASVLELLDTSIVNVAIPHMMGSLGATIDEIAWVATGYVVANVIVLPIAGWLGDFFGRRNYFALSILVFTLASIFCGNATSLEALIFWRIVQGLGGGGLLATAQAAIYESFPPNQIGIAMGIYGFGLMVGPMLGPTVGGMITDLWSWPWIFYINIPLGIFAVLLTLLYVPDSKYTKTVEQVDGLGFVLLALGIGCLQTLLERGQKLNWFEAREIVIYAITSLVALVWFVRHELRHPRPIVDLRILKDSQFAASLCYSFLLGGALYSTVFLIPVYMQNLLGFTAWDTGVVIVPGIVASALTMITVSRLVSKYRMDLRLFVVFGALLFAYTMWLHYLYTLDSGYDDFFWPMVLRGVSLPMMFLAINTLALANLETSQIAAGSGLFNLTRQLGGSVGIAISATLFTQYQDSNRENLLWRLNAYAEPVQQRLLQLKTYFVMHGIPETLAHTKALLIMDGQLARQAAMLAFEQLFMSYGLVMLLALPIMLFVRHGRVSRSLGPAH